MKSQPKVIRGPLYIAPSLVVTEKSETPALRKATFKYIPHGVSTDSSAFKTIQCFFSYQLQHFCLLQPSPNWKITIDQRQCYYFSLVFIDLLLHLRVTKAEKWKLLENLRQFHKTNTLRAFLAHSGLHSNTRRGFIFRKGQGHSDFSQKDPFKHQFIFLTYSTEVKSFQSTNAEKIKKERSQMNN